ncbi:dynactin-like protein Arp1 p62 subunit RO2 [Dendryphion nanum]|uniref:Dynactin subunit 4 n=1 Tax=Dendryphion nanum TaxID=256645 RepID=A0A9P9EDX4_9PLEO|nr:dynactin-like protein Arp1 p62 subunit RO2 [Dendryphion nanum]
MAQTFPYTYYSCDCYDSKATSVLAKRSSSQLPPVDDEDERTFDPRNPRSNYSLYPLEHLLYCEDCQQIRCPRCVTEETQNWYCPSCLFEVPSSVIKSDGHRCTRNCYNCPICISPMTVSSLENPAEPSATGGPYILACHYCHWSTIEIGIEFEKHTGITAQLSRIGNGGKPIPTQKEREKERERRKELENRKSRDLLSGSDDSPIPGLDKDTGPPSHDELFHNLSAFYKSQLAAQNSSNIYSPHDMSFASPSTYSRLLLSYSSTSKKQKLDKPSQMREASSLLEGLQIHDPSTDAAAIERIKKEGWSSTLSPTQKITQSNPSARFTSDLRPTAAILCTKRGKRCRSCRQYLSKPDSKITSTRYKIKLLALNHIPRLSLRALPPQPTTPGAPGQPFNYNALRSGIPTHFLLHLSNPLFDPIRVTLAAPSTTSGKIQSRVTILCPQFEVGANTDVWDDALTSSASLASGSKHGGDGQIEAGKIWERGRNWTSVVIEVVPGFVKPITMGGVGNAGSGGADEGTEEDEDVLEIPIFVRLEFEADVSVEERGLGDSRGKAGEKERREEAFWAVVGVGRIAGI